MTPTPAQLELLGHLIQEALSDEVAVERRWWPLRMGPVARERATAGQLLLVRDWTADVVLSRDGGMLVIDTEMGAPPRPATTSERRATLFRSIARYPELLSFLPARPPAALECPDCSGTGVLAARWAKPELRGVVCRCGGSGWLVADDPP